MAKFYLDSSTNTWVINEFISVPRGTCTVVEYSATEIAIRSMTDDQLLMPRTTITDIAKESGSYSTVAELLAAGNEFFVSSGVVSSVTANLVTDSDIGATDGTYKDQGAELDCKNKSTLGIYNNFTVSDSTGNQLQVLCKHEGAGTDEYIMESSADYQKTIGDSSKKIAYFFNVQSIPYVQIQTKATDVDTGGGTIGTITIDYILE